MVITSAVYCTCSLSPIGYVDHFCCCRIIPNHLYHSTLSYGKKALRRFDIEIPAWKIIPYELAIAWKHLGYKLKYHRADKYDFISHKL